MGKLLDRVWVGGTLALVSFLGFSSQLIIVVPSFPSGLSDAECWRWLAPFNALLLGLYLNYFLTLRTDPGRVPKGWEPDWRSMEQGETEVKRLTGGPRYCRTCRAYKPPRAHHCRQCKRCVLKMDHHCPWVGNCVGHYNYGHFCRFLFFVDAACAFHLYMVTKRAFGSFDFFVNPSTTQMVILVMNYVLCAPVLIAVGVFSLFHLWSVLTNTTTIEGWEKDKVAALKRRGKIREYRYPYHLGYLSNLKAVLGSNPLLWCWPQRSPGDGLTYPTAIGTGLKDQLLWPPRDEHVPLRHKPRPLPPDAAFTYGSGLNPSLLRAHPSALASAADDAARLRARRNRPKASARAPWQDGGGSEEELDEQLVGAEEEGEEEDDDVPLGSLAARQQRVCLGADPGAVEEDEADDRLTLSPSLLGGGAPPAVGGEEEGDEDMDPERAVRIRRGSEGYEIRPRLPWAGAALPPPLPLDYSRPSTSSDDGSWELAGYPAREEYEDEDEEEEEEASEWEVDDEGDRRRVGARYKYYVREEDSESDLESLVSVSDGG
ncbi:hypothetical protein JCM8097_009502 [Rhodosporidiobolus ruineniae]